MYKTFSNGDKGTIFPDLKQKKSGGGGELGCREDKIGGNESFCFVSVKIRFGFKRKCRNWNQLDGHVFGRIDADFEKENVVLDKVTLLEHFVRDEARESESESVGLARRPLKVLPRRIGNETLDDVTRL